MTDIRVGDYVEITKYREYDSSAEGKRGKVVRIDSDSVPYLVDTDDTGEIWAAEVRKVSDASDNSRAALVDKAKETLRGTRHDAADIIDLARFLAGE
jgi:hypothetical protein